MTRTFDRYIVTGNTTPRRLGRIFPTGWTRLVREDGACEIVTQHKYPNTLRGSVATLVGTCGMAEVLNRQA